MSNQNDTTPGFRAPGFLSGNREEANIETEDSGVLPGQMVRRTVSRGANINAGNEEMRAELETLRAMIQKVLERGSVEQKVFDSLHSELKDYKNDFFYERLKPIVRPLLFLHDSIEQFDGELETRVTSDEALKKEVRDNLAYLRAQLTEVLTICEVTPITETRGAFDTAIHRTVETVNVAPEQDNMVQRVMRSGWYLNGTLLRAVEVVRGKAA